MPLTYLLCVTCGGENATNGSHFPAVSEMASMEVISLVLFKTKPLSATSSLPAHLPPSQSIGMLVILATPVKTILNSGKSN